MLKVCLQSHLVVFSRPKTTLTSISADLRFTHASAWNMEYAKDMYLNLMGASSPQKDFNARIEVYAALNLAVLSAKYWNEPKRRQL
jgi:hypothetical protein